MKIALAGNPNCGKTTLFNRLTGTNQKTGNYAGVTVEKKEGHFSLDQTEVYVTDLPGTYSLTSNSLEERIARDQIFSEAFDWVIDIVDATNLERNLYLLVQLLEMGRPSILAVNMIDELPAAGLHVNYDNMSEILGIPVVPMSAKRGLGVDKLHQALQRPPQSCHLELDYGEHLNAALQTLTESIAEHSQQQLTAPVRWYAIKLLEADERIVEDVRQMPGGDKILKTAEDQRNWIIGLHDEHPEILIAEKRYGMVGGLVRQCVQEIVRDRVSLTEKIDKVLLHRLLGLPIFMAIMYGVFQFTFTFGEPPMGWIEAGFARLGDAANRVLPDDSLMQSLIVDGVIGGVGGVVVFLPNILLLFLALAFLEGTGYLARAAFLMDRLMHMCGLHGKSFIPMITGFGCSVPAIMATRTLERHRDRLVTMLVIPFMSCGARLPIYALIIPAFFAPQYHARMLFLIYAIGVLLAVFSAWVLRKLVFKGENSEFLMELPPYRLPTFRSTILYTAQRAWLYLRKAGTIILAISILLWALSVFPRNPQIEDQYTQKIEQVQKQPQLNAEQREAAIAQLEANMEEDMLIQSYLGRIGHAIEPVMAPIGFDWKISTAFIGAFAAKEVFVAQMGVVYSLGQVDEESQSLRERLSSMYSPLVGLSIMLFALIATPCMATFAVVQRETNSWRWPLFQLIGMTLLAWIISFVVFQLGNLLGIGI